MPADPTVLDKLRAIPGCGMRFMAQGVTFTHEGALNFAFLHDCKLCAQLLVDSLSRKARDEERERTEAALATLYRKGMAEGAVIGELCDEHLDRSGALLGRVRDRARALKEAKPAEARGSR